MLPAVCVVAGRRLLICGRAGGYERCAELAVVERCLEHGIGWGSWPSEEGHPAFDLTV